jgi:Zn-finger domain-containing protein
VEAKADGSFELHFLESGDYELYFAGYEDDDQDGQFELEGSLSVDLDLLGDLDLGLIEVEANSSTRVDLTIIGLLPL